jgi:hypothetical protein
MSAVLSDYHTICCESGFSPRSPGESVRQVELGDDLVMRSNAAARPLGPSLEDSVADTGITDRRAVHRSKVRLLLYRHLGVIW